MMTMRFDIPEELEDDIRKKGGWKSIKKSLPLKKVKEVKKVMGVLSSSVRLKILYALEEQRMCVCMLVDLTGCSYSKCSYHISKLKEAGLIKAIRKRNYLIYYLTPFGKSIVRHFNKYNPEVKNERKKVR